MSPELKEKKAKNFFSKKPMQEAILVDRDLRKEKYERHYPFTHRLKHWLWNFSHINQLYWLRGAVEWYDRKLPEHLKKVKKWFKFQKKS